LHTLSLLLGNQIVEKVEYVSRNMQRRSVPSQISGGFEFSVPTFTGANAASSCVLHASPDLPDTYRHQAGGVSLFGDWLSFSQCSLRPVRMYATLAWNSEGNSGHSA
jgi:hypothetical protein